MLPKFVCQHKQPLCLNNSFLVWKEFQVNEQNARKQLDNLIFSTLFLLKEVKLHLIKNVSTIQTIDAR